MKEGFVMENNAVVTVAELLTKLGYSLSVMERNVRILHWNYRDKDFVSIHPWLGDIYEEIAKTIDDVYEEIRKGGFLPDAKLSRCLVQSEIKELESNRTYDNGATMAAMYGMISVIATEADKLSTFADANKIWTSADLANGILTFCSKCKYFIKNSTVGGENPSTISK